MRKIAIVGAGEIGTFLAQRLTEERLDVTVIDRNPEVLGMLQNTLDVAGYLGNATSMDDLRNADIEDADLFIATTRQDETNLIACLLANELDIPLKIAVTRYLGLRGQRQALDSHMLGIDLLVNSSEAVRNEIMELVETTGASEVARFAEGRLILIGYHVGPQDTLSYLTVGELTGDGAAPYFRVACIVRGSELLEAGPREVFKVGDYVYMVTTQENLPELNDVLNVETVKSRTAVIYGDNFLSQMVAGALLNRHFHVTMLAGSEERVRLLKNAFKARHHFQVEAAAGLEVRLLRRLKVPTTSVFIATTADDASNLTACMAAKFLGVGKTIATIRRTDLAPLCRASGVDVNIAPRLATAKVIQQVVHENRVLNYRAVSQTNLEVIELEAKPKSRVLRQPLGALKLPRGVIVGGIASADGTTLPTPETRVREGDKVVVLTLPEHLMTVENLFAG